MRIFQLKTGATLQDMILIFDEAHNIEKSAKDIYEKHLSDQRIGSGIGEIDTILEEMTELRARYSRGGMYDSVIDETLLKNFGFSEQALKESQKFLKTVLLDSLMKLNVSDLDQSKATDNYNDSLISIADPALPFRERRDDFTVKLMNHGNKESILKELNKILMIGTLFETMKQQEAPDDPELMVISSCKTIANFFLTYLDVQTKNGYYPYLSLKKQENGVVRRRLNIHLSLPDIITAPVLNNVFGAILMSATLAPFETLKDVLGIQRETVEYMIGLQFPLQNRKTYVVTRDAKYDYLAGENFKKEAPDRLVSANNENPASLKYIQDSLEAVIDGADSNVLIFFQTKTHAIQHYGLLWHKYGSRVLLNRDSNSSHESKSLFYRMGEEGRRGILCTYIGGTLTEGVDKRRLEFSSPDSYDP
jgi:DNA excision repair protein ERCC-2